MIFEKIRERLQKKIDYYNEQYESILNRGILSGRAKARFKASAYKEAIDIINQVEAEYNNGWISVDDELPEKFNSVLVSCEGSIVGGTHEGEKCEFVATGYMFSKDHWQIQGHDDVKYIKVIAWQPLTEPYTPKGE